MAKVRRLLPVIFVVYSSELRRWVRVTRIDGGVLIDWRPPWRFHQQDRREL